MKTLFLILAIAVSVSAQTGAGWCANQHWIARSGRIEFVGKWSESQKEWFIRVCTKYTHAHADDQKQAKVGDLATVSTIRWGIIIHEDGRIECGQCEGVAAGSVIGKLTPEGIKSVFGSPRSVTPCLTTVTYPGTFTYSPSTTTGPMPSLIAEKPKYAHAQSPTWRRATREDCDAESKRELEAMGAVGMMGDPPISLGLSITSYDPKTRQHSGFKSQPCGYVDDSNPPNFRTRYTAFKNGKEIEVDKEGYYRAGCVKVYRLEGDTKVLLYPKPEWKECAQPKRKYAHAHIDDPKKEDPKPVAPIRIPAKQSMSLKAIDEEFQANERNYQIAKRDILQRWQIVTQQAAIEAGLTAKQLEGLEVTLGEGGYVWTPKKPEKPVESANTKH